jgi:hypothetical protein
VGSEAPTRRVESKLAGLPFDYIRLASESRRPRSECCTFLHPPSARATPTMAAAAAAAAAAPLAAPPLVDDLEARRTLSVPTGADDVELSLDDLSTTDSTGQDEHLVEYIDFLSQEQAPLQLWVRLAEELWRLNRFKSALEVLDKGTDSE